MNELIAAAKAVIDLYDYTGTVEECEAVNRLHEAVERAENPPADYSEWTARHSGQTVSPYELWTAAQQAERMRIKDLLKQSSDWFEDDQMAQANWLLEKIDATTE